MTGTDGAELALGTVQFGLAYGIAGPGTALRDVDARAILERAADHGIDRLDTAPDYGDAEERLSGLRGRLPFRVVTKVPAIPAGLAGAAAADFVTSSLDRSQRRLGSTLCGVLFHRAEDLQRDDGNRLWETAANWGAANDVAVGVSCYDPGTLATLVKTREIRMAQLPGSAFDQRMARSAAALAGVEVTIRSLFLQGLLLMPRDAATRRLPAATKAITHWHDWCAETGSTPLAAALAFAKGMPGVRYCVVGVDSAVQFDSIAETWAGVEPVIDPRMALTDPAVIDPRQWAVAA